jgi:hypothetical protein
MSKQATNLYVYSKYKALHLIYLSL